MKRSLLLLALWAVLAGPAASAEIQGKWGLSAPVVQNNSPETFAVLYAHSNRSVWAFDLAFDFRGQVEESARLRPSTGDALAFSCGPRLRSYRHPDEEFSFYFDRFLRVSYSQSQDVNLNGLVQTFDRRTAELGVGLGCEYFLPRFHAGLALHSDVARVAFVEDGERTNQALAGAGGKRSVAARAGEIAFAIRPSIVLRGYF